MCAMNKLNEFFPLARPHLRLCVLTPLALLFSSLSLASAGMPSSATPQQSSAPSPFANADRLLELGKFSEAISELEAMRNQMPPPQGLAHELGVAYYKKADYGNAILNFEKALQEKPDDGEATQLLGLSLYLGGRPSAAIPYLEKVQTWYPRANVDASYILGIAYIQSKQYRQAREAFAKMFNVPPDSAPAYLLCARMLLRLDFAPIAEEYALKAISLDPKLPMAHYLLGELYLYQSKIDQAISHLQQEMAANPGYANVYYKLADAYTRVQKFDDAERLLQRSIWLDQTSTGPYILLGKVLQKKGEPELAVRALQRAISMDPANPMPHQLLGQAYRALGQTADAERELRQADELTRNPTKP
jgi:tetratricopeptide (TPR) repeat protein